MKCIVKFKGQEKELTLQVVETPGPALFGRDWLSKIQLDWSEIKALKLSQMPEGVMQHKVDQLLQKYESVFSEGVGTLTVKPDVLFRTTLQTSAAMLIS